MNCDKHDNMSDVVKRFDMRKILPLLEDMNFTDFRILSSVRRYTSETGEDRIRVSDINNYYPGSELAATAISRSLREMEERGLIVRTKDSQDKRVTFVSLTDAGLKRIERADSNVNSFWKRVFEHYGTENKERLLKELTRLADIMDDELEL